MRKLRDTIRGCADRINGLQGYNWEAVSVIYLAFAADLDLIIQRGERGE